MWNCKNCSEEVEDNFDICWNCNFDKNGIKVDSSPDEILDVVEDFYSPSDAGKDFRINPSKIIGAGKNIKSAVYYVIVIHICSLVAIAVAFLSISREIAALTSIIIAIVSLICNILILIKLYSAGNKLENVLKN